MAKKKPHSRPQVVTPKYLPPSPLQPTPPPSGLGGEGTPDKDPGVIGNSKDQFQKRKSWMEATIFHSPYRGIFNLIAVWVTWTLILNHFLKRKSSNYGMLFSLEQWEYVWRIADLFHSWVHLLVLIPGITYLLHLTKYYVIRTPSRKWKISPRTLDYAWATWMVLTLWMTSYLIWTQKQDWFPPQKMYYLAQVLIFLMKVISFWNLESHHPPGPSQSYPESRGEGAEGVVGIGHYIRFLMAPTLVFARDYPSRKKIRRKYLIKKVLGMVVVWGLVHMIVGDYILPVMRGAPSKTIMEGMSELIIPVMIVQWLLFYLVFEIILNAFAEFSAFADREFYSDWWNSNNFGDFARKWNKPVHVWLYLHLYLPILRSWNNKSLATLLTFLVSSVFHEWFVVLVSGKLVFWLFWLQMFQLPLISISKYLKTKFNHVMMESLENLAFWSCLLVGSPLLLYLYSLHIYAPSSL